VSELLHKEHHAAEPKQQREHEDNVMRMRRQRGEAILHSYTSAKERRRKGQDLGALYTYRTIVQAGDFHHLFIRDLICTNMYPGRAFVLFFPFVFRLAEGCIRSDTPFPARFLA
jgi:hypothetical protein